MLSAARARVLGLVVGVAVLVSPALRDHDSFPLSTYPMYASVRSDVATFVTAHGERSDGSIRRLSMDVIARTDDPLIAASRLAAAVGEVGGAEAVCTDVAQRAPDDVVTVVVVRERHDVVAASRGDDSVVQRDELARCAVPS